MFIKWNNLKTNLTKRIIVVISVRSQAYDLFLIFSFFNVNYWFFSNPICLPACTKMNSNTHFFSVCWTLNVPQSYSMQPIMASCPAVSIGGRQIIVKHDLNTASSLELKTPSMKLSSFIFSRPYRRHLRFKIKLVPESLLCLFFSNLLHFKLVWCSSSSIYR